MRAVTLQRWRAAALASLVTDDGLLWAPGMEEVRGRGTMLAAAQGMFSAMSISDFEIESTELDIHGDRAYELTTYSETITPTGGPASQARGRYLIVWQKESAGWRVHRNMFHFIAGP
jgi:ketosteroid isomerase-like protein